jgi:hypothetical protein
MIGTMLAEVGLGLLLAGGPVSHPFVFRIPDGWTDLSPGAPASRFAGLPDHLTQEAMKEEYVAFAVGPPNGDGGFNGMFNAVVTPRTAHVTAALLEGLIPHARAEVAQRQLAWQVREKDVLTVSGTNVGRIVSDVSSPDGTVLRQVQYVLPGLESAAVLTYAATPQDFDRLRPVFEASALATQGVREPTFWARLFHTDRGHGMLGAVTGVVLVAVLFLVLVLTLVRRAAREI